MTVNMSCTVISKCYKHKHICKLIWKTRRVVFHHNTWHGWMNGCLSLFVCVCKICEMNDITIIEHKRSQCSNMISHIPFCFRISHIDARQCVRWVFRFLHTIHPRFLYVTINQIEYFSLWFFVLVQAADATVATAATAATQIKFVTRCAGEWKLSHRES